MQYVYWGSMVEERDGCLEGTRNWRIARFGWMCLWKDGTFLFWGDAKLAHSAVWLDVFVRRTGLLFWGDAKLAHSAVWLGCVCGKTGLLFWGDAQLAHSAIWLDVFVEGRDFCLTFVLGGRQTGA